MADLIEVKTKYCDNCYHSSYCYKPCTLVLAALWDLPCEKEIFDLCKKNNHHDYDNPELLKGE